MTRCGIVPVTIQPAIKFFNCLNMFHAIIPWFCGKWGRVFSARIFPPFGKGGRRTLMFYYRAKLANRHPEMRSVPPLTKGGEGGFWPRHPCGIPPSPPFSKGGGRCLRFGTRNAMFNARRKTARDSAPASGAGFHRRANPLASHRPQRRLHREPGARDPARQGVDCRD